MDSLDNLLIRGGRPLGARRISESSRGWRALCRPYAATTFGIRGFGQLPATAPRPRSPHRQRVGGSRHGGRWSSCGPRVFLARPLTPARSGDGVFRTLFPGRGSPTSRKLCGSFSSICKYAFRGLIASSNDPKAVMSDIKQFDAGSNSAKVTSL